MSSVGYIPTPTKEGETFLDTNLGWMVSVASPKGLVWLTVPKYAGEQVNAYGYTWLVTTSPYGFLKWAYIQGMPSLQQSFGAAAAASVKDESMGSLTTSLGSMSLAPAAKPPIKYTVVQGDPSGIQPGGRTIPLRVVPMPPPRPFDIHIMRSFDGTTINSVPAEETNNFNFTYKLPLILTYPDLPDDLKRFTGQLRGFPYNMADSVKFETLSYMKNYLGIKLNNPIVVQNIKLDDIWLMWGEDNGTNEPVNILSIIVNHRNELHDFTKEEVARLTHILTFIPHYYQLRKYQNKLWQRLVSILRRINAGDAVHEFSLNPPYSPELISAINKIDILNTRILFNPSVQEDFNKGVVYRIKYKEGASAFSYDEAPTITKLIQKLSNTYLYKGYIPLGDAVADEVLGGGFRRSKTRRSKRRLSRRRHKTRNK